MLQCRINPITANTKLPLANDEMDTPGCQPADAIAAATAEQVYEFTLPSNTEHLDFIRFVVARTANRIGFDETTVMGIEVAAEEACVNAIKHAHHDDEEIPIHIRIVAGNGKLTLAITDQGKGLDPEKLNRRDLRDLLVKPWSGGLGIPMMKYLMDEVCFEKVGSGGTSVRLVKYLSNSKTALTH